VIKFDFSHSKLRKQPSVAEIFKIQGGLGPLFPFQRPYICNVCEFLGTNYCIPKRWPMGPLQQSFPPLAQTSSYATVPTAHTAVIVTTNQTWPGSGTRGCAGFGIFERLWQTRGLENKVQLRPILSCVVRRFLCPKICN